MRVGVCFYVWCVGVCVVCVCVWVGMCVYGCGCGMLVCVGVGVCVCECVGVCMWCVWVSLMKQQFVVTHTIRQTEIPALLDDWLTNTPCVKMLCPQKSSELH